MNEEETTKPKIIVDDDWKSQAQAEKEQLQQEAAAKQSQQPEAAQDEPSPPPPEAAGHVPVPPASIEVLVSSLATQALANMGQVPGPEGKPVVQLDYAKHFIDVLGVIEEKTKGNLTPDESAMLTNVLHELRLLFVMAGKQPAETTDDSSE